MRDGGATTARVVFVAICCIGIANAGTDAAELPEFANALPIASDVAEALSPPVGVRYGSTPWPAFADGHVHSSELYLLDGVVAPAVAAAVVDALEGETFQTDLDSVDQAATHQFWLYAFNRPRLEPSQARSAVNATLAKVLTERVLPLVRSLYPSESEPLQACFSFVRRYKHTERTRHPTHFDVQSHTTFIVSLNDYGADYDGGIYVATGDRPMDRRYLPLKTGDGAVHQSDLLHGVHVPNGVRWSWVVWFAPGRCDSDPTLWHRSQADTDDPATASPIHQFLLARRLQAKLEGVGRPAAEAAAAAEPWLKRAAEAGFTRAQNEFGESLRQAGRNGDAAEWLEKAASVEPAARYNLGLIRLAESDEAAAVRLFRSACDDGSPDACFNVAVALNSGKGGVERDSAAALDILRSTDTPEAMLFAFDLSEDEADLRRASVIGSPEAQYRLARKLMSDGPEANRPEALALLQRAAHNGHRGAQQTVAAFRRAQGGAQAKRPQQRDQGDL